MSGQKHYTYRLMIFVIVFAFACAANSQQACFNLFKGSVTSELIAQLKGQNELQIPKGLTVFGRVLRGNSIQFKKLSQALGNEQLTTDDGRNIVMAFDRDGLLKLQGLSPFEMLVKLGYTKHYLDSLKKDGIEFKLVLFLGSRDILEATWENLGRLLEKSYGNEVYKLFKKYESDLVESSKNNFLGFKSIERSGPSSFRLAKENAQASPENYITLKKLKADSTLWEFRAFLYNQLGLNELFAGDGFTVNSDGARGVREYFILNQPIANLNDPSILDL